MTKHQLPMSLDHTDVHFAEYMSCPGLCKQMNYRHASSHAVVGKLLDICVRNRQRKQNAGT